MQQLHRVSLVGTAARVMSVAVAMFVIAGSVNGQLSDEDRKILRMLATAQRQHESAFPRAAMTARLEISELNWSGKLDAVWDGENYFVDTHVSAKERLRDGSFGPNDTHHQVMLIARQDGFDFLDFRARMLIRNTRKQRLEERYAVRPQDMWFVMTPTSKRTWSEKIEIQLMENSPFESKVQDLRDGRFLVTNKEIATGGVFETVYSMNHGGHILEYHSVPSPASTILLRGRYQWQAVDENRWALKEYLYEKTSPQDVDYANGSRYRLVVDDFDPNPVIPKDRFELSSLPLSEIPRLRVQEIGPVPANKNEGAQKPMPLKSNLDNIISENRFRELSDILRKGTFGRH